MKKYESYVGEFSELYSIQYYIREEYYENLITDKEFRKEFLDCLKADVKRWKKNLKHELEYENRNKSIT